MWLVYWSKTSIHLAEDKFESILFTSKCKIKKLQKLEIICNNILIKQYFGVFYLVCVLEETMSGYKQSSCAIKVISKVNVI